MLCSALVGASNHCDKDLVHHGRMIRYAHHASLRQTEVANGAEHNELGLYTFQGVFQMHRSVLRRADGKRQWWCARSTSEGK
jgi:hypothetical protein